MGATVGCVSLCVQQIARKEEVATRKEEAARSLEMATRKAFEEVQGLVGMAGQIHDAAMKAEAQAKRSNADKEAQMEKKQAEMEKQEAEVAKREIAAERAEKEAQRRKREVGQEEELLLKEKDVRRKEKDMRRQEQEANRMKEDLRQKTKEIRRLKKRLKKTEGRRQGTDSEDQTGTKGALVAAWEKLKGRISRGSQSDKKKSLARIHRYGDVERWRSMVGLKGIQSLGDGDLKSVSSTTPSGYKTTVAHLVTLVTPNNRADGR